MGARPPHRELPGSLLSSLETHNIMSISMQNKCLALTHLLVLFMSDMAGNERANSRKQVARPTKPFHLSKVAIRRFSQLSMVRSKGMPTAGQKARSARSGSATRSAESSTTTGSSGSKRLVCSCKGHNIRGAMIEKCYGNAKLYLPGGLAVLKSRPLLDQTSQNHRNRLG